MQKKKKKTQNRQPFVRYSHHVYGALGTQSCWNREGHSPCQVYFNRFHTGHFYPLPAQTILQVSALSHFE
ncbi:unnamed protein product [Staurois parvus]|uniref:Uncharacterized protein n=1 Tax=Staurois parvus TaxID=386267 RepID=A0ABN9FL49_9NEOB|nr:unnamed protein product [Staurois parvus]